MKEFIVSNGAKNIYGVLFEPSEAGRYPAVIMSHGYNGSHANWVNEGKYYSEHAELVRMEGEGHGFTPDGSRKAMEMVLRFLDRQTR